MYLNFNIDVAANTKETLELIQIREALGLTIREFAKRIDEPEPRYKNYEYGFTKKVPDRVMQKARVLAEGLRPKPEGRLVSLAGTPLAAIRVVGRVAAGAGEQNVDADESVRYVPQRLADIGGVGWEVDGESMMPALEPGDIALFREHRTPRRGYPFLLQSPREGLRVKIIDWEQNMWVLKSINPSFPKEPLDDHELLGYLIGWYRVRGSRETLDSDPGGLKLD